MARILSVFMLLSATLISRAAAPADQGLEAALNARYHDKILALRHPIEKNSQVYDAGGNVVKGGHEGSWTTYGRILVKKVHLDKNSLRIEGQRLAYRQAGKDLTPTPAGGNVKLEVRLANPVSSEEEMNSLLSHVFALTDEDMIKAAPAFWQKYLSAQLGLNKGEPAEEKAPPRERTISVVEIDSNGNVSPAETRYKIGPNVSYPHARYTPEPDYSEAARKAKYQGVLVLEIVVDPAGKVREPRILRPLGMGLDENAVDRILTWRFDPAQMDRKPVAVRMNIEVSFNLY